MADWVTWAAGVLGMFRLPASVVWAWNWYLLGLNVRELGPYSLIAGGGLCLEHTTRRSGRELVPLPGTWAAGLGFAFSGLVSNRLDSLNKTGWERGSRERTGTSSPFSQCRHGSMPELSLSSTGTALPASILEAKGMVRERRARGFNLEAS